MLAGQASLHETGMTDCDVCYFSERGEADARPSLLHDATEGQGGEVQGHGKCRGRNPRQVQRKDEDEGSR